MPPPPSTALEIVRQDGYILSTDRTRLDLKMICEWISTDCYWAIGRPHAVIRGSIENSLPLGVYTRGSRSEEVTLRNGDCWRQVAFARVVTDYYTFAWVDDIYVSRPHRKKGLSHFLIQNINALLHGTLGIKHIVLFTHDAQELYSRHGYVVFDELSRTRWMSLPATSESETATTGEEVNDGDTSVREKV